MVNKALAAMGVSLLACAATAKPAEPLDSIHRQWVWADTGNTNLQLTLDLADLNLDGTLDLLAAIDIGDSWYERPRWFTADLLPQFRLTWSSLQDNAGLVSARAASEAGAPIVVLFRPAGAEVVDPRTGETLRSFPIPTDHPIVADAGDFDMDGNPEVVVCASDGFFAMSAVDGTTISTRHGFGCTDIAVGQIDADPQLELAIAGNTLGGFIFDGSTFELEWAYLDGFGLNAALGNLDQDPFDEVVANITDNSGLRAIDPSTGATLWSTTDSGTSEIRVADLDDDGGMEVLYSAGHVDGIQVLNALTGEFVRTIGEEHGPAVTFQVADVDGSGPPEVVWLGRNQYFQYPARVFLANAETGQVLFVSDSAQSPFFGLTSGNLSADNAPEIAILAQAYDDQGERGSRILRFAAGSGVLESVGPVIVVDGRIGSRLVAANLDADPQLEVCLLFTLFYDEATLRCQDPVTGEVQWQLQLPYLGNPGALAAAELDGDSAPEIIVASDAPWVIALEGESGWLKWGTPPLGFLYSDFSVLRIGNVVGDPGPEIVVGGSPSTAGAEVVVIDGSTGSLAAPVFAGYPAALVLDLAQRDGDAEVEIVAAFENGWLAELDPNTGTVGPTILEYSPPAYSLRIADVSRDAQPDFIIAGLERVHVWSGSDGSAAWTSPFLSYEVGRFDSLWVGDFDGDSILEIAANTNTGVAVFESPLFAIFDSGFETGDASDWSLVRP